MRALTLALVAPVLLIPSLRAQDEGDMAAMMKPAAQLSKLKMLTGHWEGTGEYFESDGAEGMPWTSKMSYEWVLGGHWLREKAHVDMGDGSDGYQWTSYLGWDRQREEYVSFTYSNMGEVSRSRLLVKDDGTIMGGNSRVVQGQLFVSTSVGRYGKNSFSIEMRQSVDGAASFVQVKGDYKRVKATEVGETDAQFPMPRPNEEIKALSKMFGSYKMKGSWQQNAGSPAMPISGSETMKPIFGGSLIHFDMGGDPMPGSDWRYAGVAVMGWNASKKCYEMMFVNNMGECGLSKGQYYPEQRQMAMFDLGRMEGRLMAVRSLIEFSDDGSLRTAEGTAMHGAHSAFSGFKASYERVQK